MATLFLIASSPLQTYLVGDVEKGLAGSARRGWLCLVDRLRERRQFAAGATPRRDNGKLPVRHRPGRGYRLADHERQLLTESALMAAAGGVLGLSVAGAMGSTVDSGAGPGDAIPRATEVGSRQTNVLAFTVVIAVFDRHHFRFGFPHGRSSHLDLQGALKERQHAAPQRQGERCCPQRGRW